MRLVDWMVDAAALATTAVVGILIIGRFLDSKPGHLADEVPIVGDLIDGTRNAWHHVYDPSNAPG